MSDMPHLTTDGYTWTRDFCHWWFSVDLSSLGYEGEFYLLPHRWNRNARERIYVILRERQLLTESIALGYISISRGQFIPASRYCQRYETKFVIPIIEKNATSIINVGRRGIEGCLLQFDEPPLSEWVQHVLDTARATPLPSGEWELRWEIIPRGIDARTEFELETQVLPKVLSSLGMTCMFPGERYALVEANKTGTEWLVRHDNSKTGEVH